MHRRVDSGTDGEAEVTAENSEYRTTQNTEVEVLPGVKFVRRIGIFPPAQEPS